MPPGCAGSKMETAMCDFSLQSVQSRPAKVGDKLVTRDFGTGTRAVSPMSTPISARRCV